MKGMLRFIKQVGLVTGLFGVVISSFASAQPQWPIPQKDQAFSEYLIETGLFLEQNKEWLVSVNKQVEKDAVMPFEIKPHSGCEANGKGVLLLHGLSDSTYSLKSMGKALAEECLWVRAVLLPGHGTRAEDLIDLHRREWREAVSASIYNFSQQTDSLYVAGYSTGGTLAVDYMGRPEVPLSGLVLFSPLLKINTNADWLTPILAPFVTWLDYKKPDDYAKYASIPVPAMAQVFHLATEVRRGLKKKPLDIPVFVAMSAEDNTVSSETTLNLFNQKMRNPASELWLYANEKVDFPDKRITEFNSYNESLKITGFSHMSVHMDPEDPYYGQNGEYRVCQWYKGKDLAECKKDKQGWSGEKGTLLASKSEYGARLSWNPNFDLLVAKVVSFIKTDEGSAK